MFAFLQKADHTPSRKTRKGRNRHNRRTEFEPLEGRVVLDAAGSTIGTALDLGGVHGRTALTDFVGAIDPNDFYRVSLFNPSQNTGSLNVRIDGLSADADLQIIRDANNNGVVDAGEVLAFSNNNGTTPDEKTVSVPWFDSLLIRVYQSSGDTNYNLRVTTDFAGNSISTARNFGSDGGFDHLTTLTDFVGAIDTDDFYRVTLSRPGSLSARIDGLSADADLQIIRDANNNGVVDAGEVLAFSNNNGTTPDEKTASGLTAGSYLIKVHQSSGDTNYNLRVATDYNGNSMATAHDLGTFVPGTFTLGFVGAIDTDDFFQINLTTPRTVTGTISTLAADANLQLLDSAGNVIASSTHLGTANESISSNLNPGTYFFRVFRVSGDTYYTFATA